MESLPEQGLASSWGRVLKFHHFKTTEVGRETFWITFSFKG